MNNLTVRIDPAIFDLRERRLLVALLPSLIERLTH
jgi:hypothetical protein